MYLGSVGFSKLRICIGSHASTNLYPCVQTAIVSHIMQTHAHMHHEASPTALSHKVLSRFISYLSFTPENASISCHLKLRHSETLFGHNLLSSVTHPAPSVSN